MYRRQGGFGQVAELARAEYEASEANKPKVNLMDLAIPLGIKNMGAFRTGFNDGYEQGFELSMGMTYIDKLSQWEYDTGTYIGACLAVREKM